MVTEFQEFLDVLAQVHVTEHHMSQDIKRWQAPPLKQVDKQYGFLANCTNLLFAVLTLFQGWQTDDDRAEMQAASQVSQGLTLEQHRDKLEALLLQHKPASELHGITVITADKFHTLSAAVH